jgi:hypothetical protein
MEAAPDVLLSFDAVARQSAMLLEYASRAEKDKSTNPIHRVSRQLSPVPNRKLDGEYEAKSLGTNFPVPQGCLLGHRVQS